MFPIELVNLVLTLAQGQGELLRVLLLFMQLFVKLQDDIVSSGFFATGAALT